MKRFIVITASWFGTGFSPFASGTVGTLGAIPLFLVLARLPLPLYLLTVAVFVLLSCWISGRAEVVFGEQDSGKIVIDEVAGFLVTMTAIPSSWPWVAAGFLLFRFFDIAKVPPARWFDRRMKNGFGVVLDDVAAGLYSCISLHILTRLL